MAAKFYIKQLPHNVWIKFSDIPDQIKFDLINLLDINAAVLSVFDENGEKFYLSDDFDIQTQAINCKKIHNPIELNNLLKL